MCFGFVFVLLVCTWVGAFVSPTFFHSVFVFVCDFSFRGVSFPRQTIACWLLCV
eukprot:m.494089 g.494089  ORF g.494089 m.494089 type:complete len:54 (-) comp39474_c0_seq1:22-183(-)